MFFKKKQKLFPQKKDRLRRCYLPTFRPFRRQKFKLRPQPHVASKTKWIFRRVVHFRVRDCVYFQNKSASVWRMFSTNIHLVCVFFTASSPGTFVFFTASPLFFSQHPPLFFSVSIIVFFPSVKHPPLFFSQHHPRAQPRLRRVIAKTHPFLRLFLNRVRPATRLSANRTTVLPNRRLPLPLPTFFFDSRRAI